MVKWKPKENLCFSRAGTRLLLVLFVTKVQRVPLSHMLKQVCTDLRNPLPSEGSYSRRFISQRMRIILHLGHGHGFLNTLASAPVDTASSGCSTRLIHPRRISSIRTSPYGERGGDQSLQASHRSPREEAGLASGNATLRWS